MPNFACSERDEVIEINQMLRSFASLALLLLSADALRPHPATRLRPVATRSPITLRALASALPLELSEATWAASPTESAGSEAAEALMQRVLEWLPDMLVGLEIACAPMDDEEASAEDLCEKLTTGEGDDADDMEFVTIGRPWLHTAAFQLATGSTLSAVGEEVWGHVSSSDFLAPDAGGGGLLVLVPQLASDVSLFQQLGGALEAAAKREINGELMLQACHPEAAMPAQRCPVPLYQFFVDSEELNAGGSMADMM